MRGSRMTTAAQILLGTALLATCSIVHVSAVALSIPLFQRVAALVDSARRPKLRVLALLLLTIGVLLAAHTIQIWIWSVLFIAQGEFESLPESFYFATVTYTTLGYGDIVLDSGARIVATFAAIAGLLTFGISTAFLFGVLTRIMPDVFEGHSR
ncbi:MAG: potassium channel family protein [Pseudomonadota bacterium]